MESAKGRLKKVFADADFDKALILDTNFDDSNFLYLTGYASGWYEGCVLLADRNGMKLFANRLICGTAEKNRPKELEVVQVDTREQMADALKREIGNETVGINKRFVPHSSYLRLRNMMPKAKITDIAAAFGKARAIKDADELSKMRRAVRITKNAIESVRANLSDGISESCLAARIDIEFKKADACNAFNSIVAFGADTSMPHYMPQDSKKLRDNTIVLIDVGARYRNYCGDITRTFFYKPDRSSIRYKRLAEIYDVVEAAQQKGLERMESGADGALADKAARDYIDRYKSGKYMGRFIHTLGHSIGVDVHDGARLYYKVKYRLADNMIFSDEPGIYVPGLGGVRIEDDVVVGKRPRFI